MRGEYRRPWLKLWAIECIEGSIRWQLEPDERGTWYDILALARICNQQGTIADRDGRPFPHTFIANRLNITLELFETTLTKCKDEGRCKEDEKGIHIVNWKVYQDEYSRQKPYRDKKKGSPDDPDKYVKGKYSHMVKR